MSNWHDLYDEEQRLLAKAARRARRPDRAGSLRGIVRGLLGWQRFRRGPRPPDPPVQWRTEPPEGELFGLALSGGGIRSATFNLGVLQELARLGLLSGFHYLATVSGGGYVGGFWSAWRSRGRDRTTGFPTTPEGHAEPPEVRHLREFSNFLQPRLSLVSREAGRVVAAFATSLVPSLTSAVATIIASLLLWLAVAWLLLDGPPLAEPWRRPGAALLLGALTLLVNLAWETRQTWELEEPRSRAEKTFWVTAGAGSAITVLAWLLLGPFVPLPFGALLQASTVEPATLLPLVTILLPTAAWVTVGSLLVLVRTGRGRAAHDPPSRARLSGMDRALSQVFFCAAVWTVVGTLWWVGMLLASGGVGAVLSAAGVSTAGGGAFAWVRRLLERRAAASAGPSLLARPRTLQLLAYLTLAAATAAAAGLLVMIAGAFGPPGLVVTAVVTWGLLVAALVFFDPHESGFHSFYRARLVRAYLGASNEKPWPRATLECEGDDLALTCLPAQPLHLICCAANDLAGDPLPTLHRGADSAVLSRAGLQVGSQWSPWSRHPAVPTLGQAMTASGAAVNSHMGALSMRLGQAATFLLAALGLRLGLWLPNPRSETTRPAWPRRLRGLLFFGELFSRSSVEGPWVHLSDGGHFENLALYELVRRHCRFILLSDCGADPERLFSDFGNAVRRIREDFGVEIEIDLTPLRPGSDGRAPQAMVAGDLVYPGGDRGTLLYLKPSITGSEPPDVAHYARANRHFPHETTIDQFYDEAQWESYRRLGQHVVEQAFGDLDREEPLERVFLHARYRWPALPDGEQELLSRLSRRWTELERKLHQPGQGPLRAQVEPGLGTPRRLSEAEAVAALPLLQEALGLMELLYLQTGMSATYEAPSHPRFLGWLNRFGRWAGAPAFRDAWPLLAPLHARPFTAFMANAFRLPPARAWQGVLREIDPSRPGFAWSRWRELAPEGGPAAALRYGFHVPFASGDVQAGVVVMERTGPGRVRWRSRDFYVPPGLWGVGLGEEFLRALLAELEAAGFPYQEVTMAGERARSTSIDSLYTGAGFRRTAGSRGFWRAVV
ncbi:MAG TPA: hypothetical protein VHQ65_16205 [Thermoanaerobaculia bacterium]|nr:hypothetical protein [Thermoanaerobaculia bacterium]